MKRILAVLSILAIAGIATLTIGGQMAFGKTLVLCSALQGKLVDGTGAPVADTRIRRTWSDTYSKKKGDDAVTTDVKGAFSFGEVTHSSIMAGIVPHTPSIRCTIEADLPDGPQLLLLINKGNYERDGELGVPPDRTGGIRVTCLAGAEENEAGFYWGTCTLDN